MTAPYYFRIPLFRHHKLRVCENLARQPTLSEQLSSIAWKVDRIPMLIYCYGFV